MLEADLGLYEAARRVSGVNPGILPDSASKIAHAADLFARHVDANVVASQLALPKKAKLTPSQFRHNISEICKSDLQNIVLPEVSPAACCILGTAHCCCGRTPSQAPLPRALAPDPTHD